MTRCHLRILYNRMEIASCTGTVLVGALEDTLICMSALEVRLRREEHDGWHSVVGRLGRPNDCCIVRLKE